MSERSFFDRRYTIPGLTFILIVLIINFRYLFIFIKTKPWLLEHVELTSSIVISLFGIIGSVPIGFIVSQPWYLFWNLFYNVYYCNTNNYPFSKLRKLFNSNNGTILRTKYHYIIMSNKNKAIISYLDRRWDLINIFGSLISAILSGMLIGSALKKYLIAHISYQYTPTIDLEHIFFVSLGVIILISIQSIWKISNEHWHMTIFEIQRRKIEKKNSEKTSIELLPNNFLENNDKNKYIDLFLTALSFFGLVIIIGLLIRYLRN